MKGGSSGDNEVAEHLTCFSTGFWSTWPKIAARYNNIKVMIPNMVWTQDDGHWFYRFMVDYMSTVKFNGKFSKMYVYI